MRLTIKRTNQLFAAYGVQQQIKSTRNGRTVRYLDSDEFVAPTLWQCVAANLSVLPFHNETVDTLAPRFAVPRTVEQLHTFLDARARIAKLKAFI